MSPLLGTHGTNYDGKPGTVIYIEPGGADSHAYAYCVLDDAPTAIVCYHLTDWHPDPDALRRPQRDHIAEAREIGRSIVNTALGNYGVRDLAETLGAAIGRAAGKGVRS